MANVRAIQSVGETLRVFLRSTYPQELRDSWACSFQVLSSGELSRFEEPTESSVALTLYLYRVTVSEHMRNARQPGRTNPGEKPALPLELHWLLTAWANSAAAEHTVLAWAMSQLEQQQVLDESLLTPEGGWGPGEFVHILQEELSIDELARIWDALEPSYRLSATYVTRVVPIESAPRDLPKAVVAVRLDASPHSPEEDG